VLLGRFAWTRIADSLGINVVIVVPVLVVLGVAAAAIVLVNLVAFFPARSAARMRPAVALAAE
jgi:ABC-type lipoprotein release transport system permease subunit